MRYHKNVYDKRGWLKLYKFRYSGKIIYFHLILLENQPRNLSSTVCFVGGRKMINYEKLQLI